MFENNVGRTSNSSHFGNNLSNVRSSFWKRQLRTLNQKRILWGTRDSLPGSVNARPVADWSTIKLPVTRSTLLSQILFSLAKSITSIHLRPKTYDITIKNMWTQLNA